MPDDFTNFHKELKGVNRKAHSDIEKNFSKLFETVTQLDPIKLLSQLALTFLTIPEGQFTKDSSDTYKWIRWIEFLTGYLLTHNYPQNTKGDVDGKDISDIEDLLTKYFDSISLYDVGKDRDIDLVRDC
ncbi:MAG: hypothetical protein U9N44_07490 [Chloroflexota bacterium]|nr:hypothetical protein [Chloroflexota bacterium]